MRGWRWCFAHSRGAGDRDSAARYAQEILRDYPDLPETYDTVGSVLPEVVVWRASTRGRAARNRMAPKVPDRSLANDDAVGLKRLAIRYMQSG